METKKIKMINNGESLNDALNLAEKFADDLKLQGKNKFIVRLLTEEMFSMFKAITGDFVGEFWIACDNAENNYSLHLKAQPSSQLDYEKRRDLLSASSKGNNIASTGLMDKIRGIVEAGIYHFNEGIKIQAEYNSGMLDYAAMGSVMNAGVSHAIYSWSMQQYKNSVAADKDKNQTALEAFDELEKSIIANIADDVQVGVTKDNAEIIIIKKLN